MLKLEDGKDIDAEAMLIPYIMKTRNDATNYTLMDVRCEAMDKWIKEKREKEGEVLGEYVEIPDTKVDSNFGVLEIFMLVVNLIKDIFAFF